MLFKTIYADPPWSYHRKWGDNPRYGVASAHYSVMELDEIKMLPIAGLANKDSVLLLWATLPMLREALEVTNAWGFEYKTTAFVWVKLNPTGQVELSGKDIILRRGIFFGLGNWVRGNVEIVLLATRGHPKRLRKDVEQVVLAPRGAHSVKPEEVRRRIELLFEPPYLELFARRKAPNWHVWGKGIERTLNLEEIELRDD